MNPQKLGMTCHDKLSARGWAKEKQIQAKASCCPTRLMNAPKLFENLNHGATIIMYVARASELDLTPLRQIWFQTQKIFLPQVQDHSKDLLFAEFKANTSLVKGKFGLLEPDSIGYSLTDLGEVDLMLVPCLAVDMQYHRLGYGGGYYDTTLGKSQVKPKRIIYCAYQETLLTTCFPEDYDYQADGVLLI